VVFQLRDVMLVLLDLLRDRIRHRDWWKLEREGRSSMQCLVRQCCLAPKKQSCRRHIKGDVGESCECHNREKRTLC
jgi:hypothetical protein